jgi:hypothetical protein
MLVSLRPSREHRPQWINLINPACALGEHRTSVGGTPLILPAGGQRHGRKSNPVD